MPSPPLSRRRPAAHVPPANSHLAAIPHRHTSPVEAPPLPPHSGVGSRHKLYTTRGGCDPIHGRTSSKSRLHPHLFSIRLGPGAVGVPSNTSVRLQVSHPYHLACRRAPPHIPHGACGHPRTMCRHRSHPAPRHRCATTSMRARNLVFHHGGPTLTNRPLQPRWSREARATTVPSPFIPHPPTPRPSNHPPLNADKPPLSKPHRTSSHPSTTPPRFSTNRASIAGDPRLP